MTYAAIAGTGSYLPAKVLTNQDIEKIVDTSDEWIVERTGIKSRHIAADNETSSSMAITAAQQALESAKISAKELDLILVATCTPDKFFPSTACIVQQALGVSRIPAFDVSAACAGFIYALSVADQFIKNDSAKNVLVIGSEVMSRAVDWTDRSTCVLFGDGAGAVVLTASNQPGIHSTHIHATGEYKDLLYFPNSVAGAKDSGLKPYIDMQGHDVFKLAVNEMNKSVDETLTANNMHRREVDWLIPHQANLRIIKALAKKLNASMDHVILTVAEHGNTSAASIPLALDVGIRDGRIKRGQTMLLEGFGGGLAWGSALITY